MGEAYNRASALAQLIRETFAIGPTTVHAQVNTESFTVEVRPSVAYLDEVEFAHRNPNSARVQMIDACRAFALLNGVCFRLIFPSEEDIFITPSRKN